jgi:hypothetical protein
MRDARARDIASCRDLASIIETFCQQLFPALFGFPMCAFQFNASKFARIVIASKIVHKASVHKRASASLAEIQ